MQNFILSDFLPKTVNFCVFFPENYEFQVPIRLLSFLQPVITNKGSNKGSNLILSDFLPKTVNSYGLMSKNYEFQVPITLLRFLRGHPKRTSAKFCPFSTPLPPCPHVSEFSDPPPPGRPPFFRKSNLQYNLHFVDFKAVIHALSVYDNTL